MNASYKTNRRRPRGVLLDFYGTLVVEDDAPIGRICERIAEACPANASAKDVSASWQRLFCEMCARSVDASFRRQRDVAMLSLQRVLEPFDVDLDAEALSEDLFAYWARPALCPETLSVLARCDLPMCVVSNIDNADLASALQWCGLTFSWTVTSEDCRSYKPRPEMFGRALRLMGLEPDDVVHVGDSFGSDVRGAQAVGIAALWLNRNGRAAPEGATPEYTAFDLGGLLDVLDGGE